MTINWSPDTIEGTGALYKQLADAMERDIFSGRLRPGQRLPTHRDLADDLGVNVSTVTRAYREAERRGLISATVGRGTYVSADAAKAPAMMHPEPQAPGLLELGLIAHLPALDPDLAEGLARLSRRRGLNELLRYAPPAGLPEQRAAGAEWVARFGKRVHPEEVVICCGVQHALTVSLASLFKPGQRIATGSLVFPGVKSLATMLGLRLVPIPLDEEGPTPEGLDTACRRGTVHGAYLISTLHNPTAARPSAQRCAELAAVCRRHGLTVVEDDTFALSAGLAGCSEGERVSDHLPESSVFLSGVSKSLCAGLRIAYACAPKELRRPLMEGVLNTVWMAPPLSGALFSMWLSDGTAERVLEAKLAEASRRRELALEILSGLETVSAPFGPFLWLKLPEPFTGAELEQRARGLGVNLFGAEKFAVGDASAPPAARLALSSPESIHQLRQGLTVVRDILNGSIAEPLTIM